MRLFYAVELPEAVRDVLGRLRPRAGTPGESEYRWVDPAQMHLTLAFLGEQPADRLPLLLDLGGRAAQAARAAVLSLGEAGSFGSRRAPRVLWVGLAGDVGALTRLQNDLDARLRAEGFQIEDRPFAPHVTLARRRPNAPPASSLSWPGPPPRIAPFTVDELTLFESQLSPRGARYTAVGRFEIA